MLIRYVSILCFLLLSALNLQAAERILNYQTHITVEQSGDLLISEKIRVNAEHAQIKRGIFRDFPTKYKLPSGQWHHVGFEVISVMRNGVSEPFHIEDRSNGKRIYIGNKDKFVDRGEHEYEIYFRTNRQIQFLDHRDELYFNAIPHGFVFPIDKADVTLSLPSSAYVSEYTAYTGSQGSTQNRAKILQITPFEMNYSVNNLGAYEGMTILAAWNKGAVSPPSDAQKREWMMQDFKAAILAGIGLVAVFGYLMFAWFSVGRDPKGGSIIPLFTPPEGLSPAACQYIRDRKLKPTAFTAAIVNMAVKGFHQIEVNESKNTYHMTKTGKKPAFYPSEETLASQLYGNHLNEQILGGKYSKTIANAQSALKDTMANEYAKENFRNNRLWFFVGAFIAVVFGAIIVFQAQRPEMIFFAIFSSIIGIVMVSTFKQVAKAWRYRSVFRKAMAIVPALIAPIAFISVAGPLIETFGNMVGDSVDLVAISVVGYFVVSGLMLMLFYWLLEAPTVAGRATLDKIEGFKLYLATAEKDLLNFQHPPEKTPALFEKYLPYAIALGVENEWGEKFTDVLSEAAATGNETMRWYRGDRSHSFSSMSAGLASGLDSAIASSSTPPSSSGSGFSGGSSGGGGGGGGGGGW